MDVVFIFQWLDASALADFTKTWAGLFAAVQTVHILSMVMLCGMMMLGDLRMMNVILKGVPSEPIIENTKKWIYLALVLIILTGIYEASAIAMKLAYNSFFFAKMAGLSMGIIFMLSLRNAVYLRAPEEIGANGERSESVPVWVVKLVAFTSLLIWFTVAASGRWIGFS
ncbi:hypothetical protein A9Q89_05120 [Gammaproteobacteria bacterium 53_120_T64]|nr:hypothetical protein A9Q89_05120 [Gammaproteobacteria bacterium 53_120_T64]